jgi:Mg/Co/Ni transporter MgtE
VTEEFEKFIRPIRNASSPGTLAALSLAVLKIGETEFPTALKLGLVLGAILFLLSAFFIFFCSIYPTSRKLWIGTAITFLLGLFCLILSSVAFLFVII